jgi:hypothetical protein
MLSLAGAVVSIRSYAQNILRAKTLEHIFYSVYALGKLTRSKPLLNHASVLALKQILILAAVVHKTVERGHS